MQALKAMGGVIQLKPAGFMQILERQRGAIVVRATGGIFSTNYQYLTTYKGLTFFTKAKDPIVIPDDADLLDAESIWVPYG